MATPQAAVFLEGSLCVCLYSHSESAFIVLSLLLPYTNALCVLLQACRRMHAFGSQECRMARVCFSKYLYAMLTHENFTTPQHPTFSMPARSSSHFKAHELGMKLVSIRQCTLSTILLVLCVRTHVSTCSLQKVTNNLQCCTCLMKCK